MKIAIFTVVAVVALTACQSLYMAPKIEYAKVCDPANSGKKFAVDGFLQVTDRVPCMKSLSPGRECAFKLADKVNVVGKEVMLKIKEGSGNGMVETPESGKSVSSTTVFTRADIKILLSDGSEIVPQPDIATPVTVNGEVYVSTSDSGLCTITAESINKR